jgi:glycosyltransferase involved in cell wall biosynthesis
LDLVGVSAWHRRQPAAGLVPPVPVRRFPLPRQVLYESWQRLRAPSVERLTGHVDVVHDAGYVVPPSKAPLVATVHDLAFLTYPQHYTWHSREVFRRGLELTRRHARLVMCPSLATKAACQDAGIDAERLRVVPLGVRVAPQQAEHSDRVRRRYGLERPFILFVGTIEPRKNLHRVLEAFRELDAAEMELILVGPQGWKEDVDDALDGSRGRARTLGYLPREALDVLYAEAAAVVYPSLAEGFGLPVLEAMASGVPVVAAEVGGMRDFLVDGRNALLHQARSPESLAAALRRAFADPAVRARLAEAGLETVREQFDEEVLFDRYAALIESAVARR